MHSHPFNTMSPCICNAMRQCMLYHATCIIYMDNTIHTTYRVSWTITSPAYDFHTSFHSCQYMMHAYINISFYAQAMTHTQLSYVMAICTYKLFTCQYIRTHILTSKHVTLSQTMTLSNKSYNGPKASHKQSQIGLRDQPQTGYKHKPHIVTGARLGVAYLRLGEQTPSSWRSRVLA